jgi:hypothetical protein
VLGYPHAWLRALANDLSTRVGAAASLAAPTVEVVDATTDDPRLTDVEQRPAGSQVEIERRAGGISLRVPPAGFAQRQPGLVRLWNLSQGDADVSEFDLGNNDPSASRTLRAR